MNRGPKHPRLAAPLDPSLSPYRHDLLSLKKRKRDDGRSDGPYSRQMSSDLEAGANDTTDTRHAAREMSLQSLEGSVQTASRSDARKGQKNDKKEIISFLSTAEDHEEEEGGEALEAPRSPILPHSAKKPAPPRKFTPANKPLSPKNSPKIASTPKPSAPPKTSTAPTNSFRNDSGKSTLDRDITEPSPSQTSLRSEPRAMLVDTASRSLAIIRSQDMTTRSNGRFSLSQPTPSRNQWRRRRDTSFTVPDSDESDRGSEDNRGRFDNSTATSKHQAPVPPPSRQISDSPIWIVPMMDFSNRNDYEEVRRPGYESLGEDGVEHHELTGQGRDASSTDTSHPVTPPFRQTFNSSMWNDPVAIPFSSDDFEVVRSGSESGSDSLVDIEEPDGGDVFFMDVDVDETESTESTETSCRQSSPAKISTPSASNLPQNKESESREESESEEEPEERGKVIKIRAKLATQTTNVYETDSEWDSDISQIPARLASEELEAGVRRGSGRVDHGYIDLDIARGRVLRNRIKRTPNSQVAPTTCQVEEKEDKDGEAVRQSGPPTCNKRRKVTATLSSTHRHPEEQEDEEVGENEHEETGAVVTASNARRRKRAATSKSTFTATKVATSNTHEPPTSAPSGSTSNRPIQAARRTSSGRKQGPFDTDEEARLLTVITEFARSHDIPEHHIGHIIVKKDPSNDNLVLLREFWKTALPVFPERRTTDVKEMIERRFDIYKSNKKWTPEDDGRLRELAEKYTGEKRWITIGSIMERYADACRDRYRNYASCGPNRQRGIWKGKELGKMFDVLATFIPQNVVEMVKVEEPPEEIDDFGFAPDWMKVSQMMGGIRSRKQCLFKWQTLYIDIQRPKVLRLLCGWQPELTPSLRACRMQIYSMRDADVLNIISDVARHVPSERRGTRLMWKTVEGGRLTNQWPVSTLRILWRRLRQSLLPGSWRLLDQEAAVRMAEIAESEGLSKYWSIEGDKSVEQRIVEGEDVQEIVSSRRRGRPRKQGKETV